ncbi:MAG: hypothetical protein HIU89_08445 [Proteobacteria bacterium]|nr:hypothetical protein [Pseudomonadota bacterium]
MDGSDPQGERVAGEHGGSPGVGGGRGQHTAERTRLARAAQPWRKRPGTAALHPDPPDALCVPHYGHGQDAVRPPGLDGGRPLQPKTRVAAARHWIASEAARAAVGLKVAAWRVR